MSDCCVVTECCDDPSNKPSRFIYVELLADWDSCRLIRVDIIP